MVQKPKISVIMPCYNHENFIDEAIRSILDQSIENFELVLINDGSTDETQLKIDKYSDPRLITIKQENFGPSEALNRGIKESQGNFIALMSGDDISLPTRLEIQYRQLIENELDAVFNLPEIIGPSSEILGDIACPWFYAHDYQDNAELLRILFFEKNFLCAPTFFCRREVFDELGLFQRGLIQLQDFDFWIRLASSNKKNRLFTDRVIEYRYLFGDNLSSSINRKRSEIELATIYPEFFRTTPKSLFIEAFKTEFSVTELKDDIDIDIVKAFLYLDHKDEIVRNIGAKWIVEYFGQDEYFQRLISKFGYGTKDLKNLSQYFPKRGENKKELTRGLLEIFIMFINFVPRWREKSIEKKIEDYISENNVRKAIFLAKAKRRFPPEERIFLLFRKVILKLFAKISKFRFDFAYFLVRSGIILRGKLIGIFILKRHFDWAKTHNLVFDEQPLEKIVVSKPKVYGLKEIELNSGETFCPPAYITDLKDVIITGRSSMILTKNNEILMDELFDHYGPEYGIKSPYILYKHKEKVLVNYVAKSSRVIREGILLATDHDINYFHWMVEVLPKLAYIDSTKEFLGQPLLISAGLHKNFLSALEKININNRKLIELKHGFAYKAKRVIVPSGLSRINDRYQGRTVFGKDAVLSHKWIGKVGNQLKKKSDRPPWRKVYIHRGSDRIRSIGNLDNIEQLMIQNGFEFINLDRVSLDYQIELFSQVKILVTPTGAALTNIMFCPPGTRVIVFMSDHESSNYYFWSILGNIFDVKVEIIVGKRMFNISNKYSVHDDYKLDVKLVEEVLGFG